MTKFLQALDTLRASAALPLRHREGYLGLLLKAAWRPQTPPTHRASLTLNAANAPSVFNVGANIFTQVPTPGGAKDDDMTILPRILPDRLALVLLLALVAVLAALTPAVAQSYTQHNLVSDLPGVAPTTDPNLVNPWSIVFPPKGPFWISDNNAGVSTLYDGNGNPFPVGFPLVVMIPPPTEGSGSGSPTGVVFNGTADFVVSNGTASKPGVFLFATEDGTISGWAPQVDVTHAILAVDNSAPGGVDGFALGAVYKGRAVGNNGSGNFIYATKVGGCLL